MARKKRYIEVAEGTLVRGENWQEVYEELKDITPEKMQERIQEIDEETQRLASETFTRQTAGRLGNNSNRDANEKTINEMLDISTQLQGERNILEAFPKVDKKVKIIESVKIRAEKRKSEEAKALERANRRLKEAENRQKKLNEKMSEIDEELEEARNFLGNVKGKTSRMALSKTISDLEVEKGKLGDKSEVDKEVEGAKREVKDYNDRQQTLSQVIARCTDPWNNVLKGMGWKAVASMPDRELKEKLGMPKKKDEPQKDGSQEGKPDDQQGRGNGRNDSGNTGTARGSGSVPGSGVPPIAPQDPDLDPDLDPDIEGSEISWIERMRAKREERKTQKELDKVAKKVRREEFRRAFRNKYKGDPSLLDKLALKFPKLGRFLGKDFSNLFEKGPSFDEQLEASLNELSEEERREKIRLGEEVQQRSAAQRAEQAKKDELDEQQYQGERAALEEQNKEDREAILAGMNELSIENIEAVASIWIAEGIVRRAEIEKIVNEKAGKKVKCAFQIPEIDETKIDELRTKIDGQLGALTLQEVTEREPFLIGLGIYNKVEMDDARLKASIRDEDTKSRQDRIKARQEAEKRQVSRTRGLREKINNGKAIPTPKAKAPDKTAEGATVLTKNASEGKPVVESSR